MASNDIDRLIGAIDKTSRWRTICAVLATVATYQAYSTHRLREAVELSMIQLRNQAVVDARTNERIDNMQKFWLTAFGIMVEDPRRSDSVRELWKELKNDASRTR